MINWVLAVYFINLVCLAVNWAVYFRNCRLDAARLANKQAARIIDSSVNTLLIATDGSKASLEAITFAAHAIDLKKVENIEVLSVAGNPFLSEEYRTAIIQLNEYCCNQHNHRCRNHGNKTKYHVHGAFCHPLS